MTFPQAGSNHNSEDRIPVSIYKAIHGEELFPDALHGVFLQKSIAEHYFIDLLAVISELFPSILGIWQTTPSGLPSSI